MSGTDGHNSRETPPAVLDLLRDVLDAIPLAAMVLAPGYRIVSVNRAAIEGSGKPDPVAGGLSCYEVSHHCGLLCNGPGDSCPLNQVIASKSPVRQIHRRHDEQGVERLTEVSVAPIFGATGDVTHVVGVLRDVTGDEVDRQGVSLEKRVSRLGELVEAYKQSELRERKRLAHVLREDLQQLLFGAVLTLGGLRQKSESESEIGEDLRQLTEVIGQTMELSRSVAMELCPSVLSDGSMTEILEWLASWMRDTHDLETEIDVDIDEGADPAGEEVRIFLLEAVRELLLNVVAHAKVRRARVEMKSGGDRALEIVVSDEGIGYAPPMWEGDEVRTGQTGLLGIRERIERMGGKIDIVSSPGRGSRIALTLRW